jgi:hypothetical protein
VLCVAAAISAVAEYTHNKDHNADIQNLFLTQEYTPGQPVNIQLYHVDFQNPENSTLEPMTFSVADWFLSMDNQGFTVKPQGECVTSNALTMQQYCFACMLSKHARGALCHSTTVDSMAHEEDSMAHECHSTTVDPGWPMQLWQGCIQLACISQ